MEYAVFYEGILIGRLEINEKGQHRYTPYMEGVKAVEESISVFYELLKKSDWREPIPVLKNRLDDARCFSKERYVANQTDRFVLVLVNEG